MWLLFHDRFNNSIVDIAFSSLLGKMFMNRDPHWAYNIITRGLLDAAGGACIRLMADSDPKNQSHEWAKDRNALRLWKPGQWHVDWADRRRKKKSID